MNKHDVWDVLLGLIVAMPAIISALSSLSNGRKIDKQNGHVKKLSEKVAGSNPVKKRPNKNGQHPDWYRPPDV